MKKFEYSKLIGLKKTLKNVAVTFGLPALMYLVDHYVDFVPNQYLPVASIFAGGIGYFIKNYVENKN